MKLSTPSSKLLHMSVHFTSEAIQLPSLKLKKVPRNWKIVNGSIKKQQKNLVKPIQNQENFSNNIQKNYTKVCIYIYIYIYM